MSECKETYKECLAAHTARYQKVVDERQAWDTQQDLADRAGCSIDTIQRLLQKTALAVDCNNEEPQRPKRGKNNNNNKPYTQEELTIYELKKIHAKARKQAVLNWIAENWNVTITPKE